MDGSERMNLVNPLLCLGIEGEFRLLYMSSMRIVIITFRACLVCDRNRNQNGMEIGMAIFFEAFGS